MQRSPDSAAQAGQARVSDWKDSYGVSLNAWATEVPDIAGTGTNVAAGMSAERRTRFLQRAVMARERTLKAVHANTSTAAQRHLAAAAEHRPAAPLKLVFHFLINFFRLFQSLSPQIPVVRSSVPPA